MTTKYDAYYEDSFPYTMTMEEYSEIKHPTEREILALIRGIGIENVRFYMKSHLPQDMLCITPLGMMVGDCSGMAVNRIVQDTDPMYNPLVEKDRIRENHWYHPYKIMLTPTEFNGCVEKMYFSDFCSMVEKGYIQIWDISNWQNKE